MNIGVIAVMIVAIGSASGCGSTIDGDGLPPIDDYTDWYQAIAVGDAPGHGNSYRLMFANDIAREFAGVGRYPIGSIIVKEIRELSHDEIGAPVPGNIRYIAVMRRLEEPPTGTFLDNGWLYTVFDAPRDPETRSARCYRTCHQAAPFDGTFLDWSP